MRFILTLAVLFVLVGAAAVGALRWFENYTHAPGPLGVEKVVFIAPGTSVRAMSMQLLSENAIEQPYAFLVLVRLLDVGTKIKAGEYVLEPHISLRHLVSKMAAGDVYVRKVTIPEGFWSSEVLSLVNTTDGLTGTLDTPPAEGSILPDTYVFIRGDAPQSIIADAQAAMRKALQTAWDSRAEGLPLKTPEEALVLASIVEKETGVAHERARIAGVFVNRLRAGMMLQSDPTVIYAVTQGQEKLARVLYAHLDADSPYNTYRVRGLPPGPICNPGIAAIQAVLHPETHDYLYFVADGTGAHIFASTLAEHNANVANWRGIQRARRATGDKAVDGGAKAP